MPTNPQGIKTVRLHGLYTEPNLAGTPGQGTVTFTPSPAVITFPTENVIVSGTESVTLDATGAFEISLICTDTAGQNPDGWTYTVVERIIGTTSRTYQIFLPYTDTSVNPVELADITPTVTAPTYLPVIGPQGPPGIVQTVNGKTGISITLVPADLGAIASTEKGAASGVATLDGSSHLTASQYDWSATTPISVADAGAVGTSTKPARSDHTHAGVDLANNQTVAGIKTFSSIPVLPASDPTTSNQAARKAYVDTGVATAVHLTGNETVGGVKTFSSSPVIPTPAGSTDAANKGYVDGASTFTGLKTFQVASSSAIAEAFLANADTNNRFQVQINGTLSWGSGSGAVDTTLSRSGAGTINNTGNYLSTVASGSVGHSVQVTSDTNNRWQVAGSGTLSWGTGAAAVDTTLSRLGVGSLGTGGKFTVVPTGSAAGLSVAQSGDTVDRITLFGNSSIGFGPGGATAQDVTVARSGTAALTVTATTMTVTGTTFALGSTGLTTTTSPVITVGASTTNAVRVLVTSDTQDRLQILGSGKMQWGTGAAVADTVLYRNGINILKTDGTLQVGVDLTVTGNINSATNVNMGAWSTFVPTWTASITNPTLGNGSLTSRWCRIGRMIFWNGQLTLGSTSNGGTGVWYLSVPVTPASNGVTMIGTGHYLQAGVNEFIGISEMHSSLTKLGIIVKTGTSSSSGEYVTNALPVGASSSTVLLWSIMYEAAS